MLTCTLRYLLDLPLVPVRKIERSKVSLFHRQLIMFFFFPLESRARLSMMIVMTMIHSLSSLSLSPKHQLGSTLESVIIHSRIFPFFLVTFDGEAAGD